MMPLAYLATPYTRYPAGPYAAFVHACELAARLIRAGVHVYSPIAHSHPIALHGAIDPLDQAFWNDVDAVMLDKCDTLLVAHMDGWEQSSGIRHEVETFERHRKPIFDLDPQTLAMVRRT